MSVDRRTRFKEGSIQELFEQYINRRNANMTFSFIELTSGDIHRNVGGYPGKNHKMVIGCNVMYKRIAGDDEVISAPPSGKGATATVRYYKKNYQGGALVCPVSVKKTAPKKTASDMKMKPNEVHLMVCGTDC